MRRFILIVMSLVMITGLITGCGRKAVSKNRYDLYYLSINGYNLMPEGHDKSDFSKDMLEASKEIIELLQNDPESDDMRKPIPSSVKINSVTAAGYSLVVDFDEGYQEFMSDNAAEELFVRAAIVKSLVQIDGVNYVNFTVNGENLKNKDGENIGLMNLDSFVENPEQKINSSVETNLTLYYASEDGSRLVAQKMTVHYSSSVSLEKVIMEKLIEGPKDEGAIATIPSNTKIITISVNDGICYVNLDDGIKNQNETIQEQIVLYSIVDSLTALDEVDKVQISINGDTTGKLRYNYDLSQVYEADLSLLQDNTGEHSIQEAVQ